MSFYQKIADDIRAKIIRGLYKQGDMLPKQIELAKQYSTSRVTIQKALHLLQFEGVIFGKKGIGTFVAEQTSLYDNKVQEYIGVTRKYADLGKISSKIISFEVRFPDEIEQNKLKVEKNDPVYDIIRLRLLNNEPFLLEYTIMPVYVIPGINEKILNSSIYAHITNELKLTIGASVRRIRADKSDAYDQKFIDCAENDPVLEVDQIVYLTDGTPFEYSQTRHRYDKGDFTVTNTEHHIM
ncbi:GntR family transcriptional regulator [Pilibacter termitis]|uniref:GntR family transcriptional regulator n=1 Tax=Pilibacter termitis TaxID=263852 RepID=A0A1T4LMP4_9ENTE|nr:GntR family transcriptional regulator [Pilibacter termitis]SJZ55972.1 GntR family transcriptional regulator [Pilibacter termitis]